MEQGQSRSQASRVILKHKNQQKLSFIMLYIMV